MNSLLIESSGPIMMALWIAYVTIGFTSQIRKNHIEKNFGQSLQLFGLAYLTYIFGSIYGLGTSNLYISIPYMLGFFFLTILLYQAIIYKR